MNFLKRVRQKMTLSSYLALLVAASVLPLLVFTALMFRQNVQLQQQAVERGMRDTARALTLAIDREIAKGFAVLHTLAQSQYLELEDFNSFHLRSFKAIEHQRGAWIVLFDRSGRQVVNTRFPFGSPLPNSLAEAEGSVSAASGHLPVGTDEAVRRVIETGRPMVTDLFLGAVSKQPSLAVNIPVTRSGEIVYSLNMSILPQRLTALLREQGLPDHWVAAIVDKQGMLIAHSIRPERFVGQPATSELVTRVTKEPQGFAAGLSWDGVPLYQAFVRSNLTGWTTVVGVARAAVDTPVRQSIRAWGTGAAVLWFFGMIAAVFLGRRISKPIGALAESAGRIQRGHRIQLERSGLREIAELHNALYSAGEAARQAGVERERRLIAEVRQSAAEAAQDELFRRERLYATLVENLPDSIFRLDRNLRYLYISPSVQQSLGCAPEQFLGKTGVEAGLPENIYRPFEAKCQSVLQSGHPELMEFAYQTPAGLRNFISRIIPEYGPRGSVESLLGINSDITEQKRTEETLRDADRRKDEFLAMLGHELRNPLGIISTSVQLLRRRAPSDRVLMELQEMIARQTQHMARMLDDLLDVSRIMRGQIRLKKELCDLVEIVRHTVEDHRSAFHQSGLTLISELPDQPLWMMADRTRLSQIVANLIYNANKFTDRGGTVTIRLVPTPRASALLSVRDTGIGMESEMLGQLFQPFMQLDTSIDRSRGGLGLGLALVKGVVELHGGEVRAESEGLGRGAEFIIRLPLHEQAGLLYAAPAAVEAENALSRRILIIEDNATAARSMRMYLELAGHSVEAADTGPGGIEAARRFHPHVVLCDIGLPGLDGYGVARHLRQEAELAGVYLIAVSGYGQEADQRRARDEGFDVHMTKPIDLDELEQILARLNPAP